MKLSNASAFFDRDFVEDAYTGEPLFRGQFSSYDGSKPDGSFEQRRTVSVAHNVPPAPRRAVRIQGQVWVMGELMLDTFNGGIVRQTASAKLATDLFCILTPAQAALRTYDACVHAYGYAYYLKDTVNPLSTSEYNPFYDVTFGSTELVPDGAFLRSNNLLLHARATSKEPEGFIKLSCDYLPNSEVEVTFAGAFDPITETAGTGVTTTGILTDMYKLYDYKTQADRIEGRGDKTLVVAQSAVTPYAGQTVSIAGVVWRVFGFTPYTDAWRIHLKLVG